jgi:hypothetical protein
MLIGSEIPAVNKMAATNRIDYSFQFNMNRECNLLATGGNMSQAHPTATPVEYDATQKKRPKYDASVVLLERGDKEREYV